jgi:YidC/Oxa1 family membrane protein insertase
MSPDSGWTWIAATVALAITVRMLLAPLSIYEVKNSRTMRRLSPQVEELRREHGDDNKRMSQEQRKLWKEVGAHPLLVIPVLLLRGIIFLLFLAFFFPPLQAEDAPRLLSGEPGESFAKATIFGDSNGATLIDAGHGATKLLAAVLVVLIIATLITARRQHPNANMPSGTKALYEGPEKLLLVVPPAAWALAGLFFPVEGLFFFATWYLWTLGEQSMVIRYEPRSTQSLA